MMGLGEEVGASKSALYRGYDASGSEITGRKHRDLGFREDLMLLKASSLREKHRNQEILMI